MARVHPNPEDVFLKWLKRAINNLFVENKNFKNGWYHNQQPHEIIKAVQENGRYILERIEEMEHLVKQMPPSTQHPAGCRNCEQGGHPDYCKQEA